jgi:catechol 2,3-dioxygenase-like lactoylglutathione lyase family enzyme
MEQIKYPSNKSEKKTHITQVGTVFVPVADQDLALEFYTEKLGFEKLGDWPYGDGSRWVEVAPPGSANKIALVPQSEGKASRSDITHCAFASTDIEADHIALQKSGVEVDKQIAQKGKSRTGLISTHCTIPDPAPPQFCFRDIDGNRFLIVQVS